MSTSGFLTNQSVARKLAGGFGVMILIVAAMAAAVWYEVSAVTTLQTRVLKLRQPTILASTNLVYRVNHTLAALRGYMILDKQKFKDERRRAWTGMDLGTPFF